MNVPIALRDDMATEFVALLNAGLGSAGELHIFDGTLPDDTEDADAGTLLVVLTLSSTAVSGPFGGTFIGFNTITAGTVVANGTAGYFRFKDSGGTTWLQGTCAEVPAAGDLLFSDATFAISESVGITFFTIDFSMGTT